MTRFVNEAAKIRYRSNGTFECPGLSFERRSAQVSRRPVPLAERGGVVLPRAGPEDRRPQHALRCKGLLKSAIRDNDPVLFFEHKKKLPRLKGEVADGDYVVPLGKADVKQKCGPRPEHHHVRHRCAPGARSQRTPGQRRHRRTRFSICGTSLPLDTDAIKQTVAKTSKVLILHEDNKTGGIGAEVAALIRRGMLRELDRANLRGWPG